jgi:hypothetical protein
VIVLVTPHLFKSDLWRLRNLHGIFELLGSGSSRVLRHRLELGRGALRVVRAGMQRIDRQIINTLVRPLLKSAVQYNADQSGGPTQGCSFLPGVAAVDGVVTSSAVYAGDFGRGRWEENRVGRRAGNGLSSRMELASRDIEPGQVF